LNLVSLSLSFLLSFALSRFSSAEYIHPYNRNQYGAGGFIYGGLNTAAGICLALLLVKLENARSKAFTSRLLLFFAHPILLLAGAIAAWVAIIKVFTVSWRKSV
jgi:hypothetical protein